MYERLFRGLVGVLRRLRPHRWPLIGPIVERQGARVLRATHPAVMAVDGHRVRVDAGDDLGLARGAPYEPLLEDVLRRHVPSGGTVVDGGAHIGYFTLVCARAAGPSGRVIAFEPAPATFALLEENVRVNGYTNVTLVPGALSDASGTARLHLSPENTGDHRIGEADGQRDALTISTHALDDVLPDGTQVDVVKLDVQGAEPLVLRGAARVLTENPGLVLMLEWAPFVLPAETSEREVLEMLFARFARIRDLDEARMEIVDTDPEAVLATYTRENERFTNLLCTP